MNIGDTYSWTPAAFEGASGLGSFEKLRTVHGRIVYINEAHRTREEAEKALEAMKK